VARFVQAQRAGIDGPVSVKRPDENFVLVTVTTDGRTESILMTEHNASRVFAMLAVMLEIPLSPAVGKAIKL
jgi:hypothetical protein